VSAISVLVESSSSTTVAGDFWEELGPAAEVEVETKDGGDASHGHGRGKIDGGWRDSKERIGAMGGAL
jgi:hypothetical protein